MRSGNEDGARHSRIALEEERALQKANRRRIAAQFVGWDSEEALPQTVAARTDERVREQPAHAVADNDNPVRRQILITRIDDVNRMLELIAQSERVQQNRCTGTVIEVPELKLLGDF